MDLLTKELHVEFPLRSMFLHLFHVSDNHLFYRCTSFVTFCFFIHCFVISSLILFPACFSSLLNRSRHTSDKIHFDMISGIFISSSTHAHLINVPEIWQASKMGFTRRLFSVKRTRTSGNEKEKNLNFRNISMSKICFLFFTRSKHAHCTAFKIWPVNKSV